MSIIVNQFSKSPINIQDFHGKQAIDFNKLNTVGDGDCLLHALYGGENLRGQIQVPDAADMKKRLCNDILDHDEQIRPGVQAVIARGGPEHPILRSYGEHNQIEEQPQNIVNLATSLGRPGEYLGLEHVELIARLKNLNILVYNERTEERVELFYKEGFTEIDHIISYNGINHWSKLISTSQSREIDYPNTPSHYPGIFYFFSSTTFREKKTFEKSIENDQVVAFYLKKARDADSVDSSRFYLKLAAINLTDLVDRVKSQKDIQPILFNLFSEECPSLEFFQTDNVFDALLEVANWEIGRSNLFKDIDEKKQTQYVSGLLYERFQRSYNSKEYVGAKIYFYHYICLGSLEKNKIDQATGMLSGIFRHFQGKTYVPYGASNIKNISRGMEMFIHIDLVLYNFLDYYHKHKEFCRSEDINTPQIADWTLVHPFQEKKKEIWRAEVWETAIPFSRLNTELSPIEKTYKFIVKEEKRVIKTSRLDIKNESEFIARRESESQIARKVASSQGSKREVEQEEKRSHEDISGRDVEEGFGKEHRENNTKQKESEAARTETSREQMGIERMVSNQLATEDGVELSHSHYIHDELTNMEETRHESSATNRKETDHSYTKKAKKTQSTDNKKTSQERGWKDTEIKQSQNKHVEETTKGKKQLHRTTREEGHSLTSTGEQEKGTERQYRDVVTDKTEVGNDEKYQHKFGSRREHKRGGDLLKGRRTADDFQVEENREKVEKTVVAQQSSLSAVISRGQEYEENISIEKEREESEGFEISPGYLSCIKIDSCKTVIVTGIKQTLEMDVFTAKKLELRSPPDYLRPLLNRLKSVCNRRFFQMRYEVQEESSPTINIKNLALPLKMTKKTEREGVSSRQISLNKLYYSLENFLRQNPKKGEINLVKYAKLRNNYMEQASIDRYDSARSILEEMFDTIANTPIFYGKGFGLLLEQFKIHGGQHKLVADPPNRGAGTLFFRTNERGETPQGLLIGHKRITLQDSFKNLLVSGGVGCGKTSTVCIPNLLTLTNCSILVTDVSGEIYERTHQAMIKKGFEVKVFDIENASEGDIFNPLAGLKMDSFSDFQKESLSDFEGTEKRKMEVFDDTKRIVSCIMQAAGFDESGKNAFFVGGGKVFLELCLAILIEEVELKKCPTITLRGLYDQVNKLSIGYLEEVEKETSAQRVKQLIKEAKAVPDTFMNCLSFAKKAVAYFCAPSIDSLTSPNNNGLAKSSIDFDDLRKRETVVYLKIGVEQFSNYKFLLSLFYDRFFIRSFKNSKAATGQEKLPVICLMDEFGHTPIPDFQKIITTLRKHEVAVVGMVQSLSQLTDLYGEANAKTIMNGGFTSKLYFSLDPSDKKIAEEISAASGIIPEKQESELPIDEIINPGKNRATFLHAGTKAIQLELTPYFRNSEFQVILSSVVGQPTKPNLVEESKRSESTVLKTIQLAINGTQQSVNQLRTVGDGDCLLHALYGGENLRGQIQVPDAADMKKRLCNDILDHDEQIRPGVQAVIARGGPEHPILRSYGEHNQIEEQPQNIVNLATSLGRPGEYLGLEHVELIARLKNLNILVYNERTEERVELFYKEGSTEIDHIISYNGINHWSKLISNSQSREIDYPKTPTILSKQEAVEELLRAIKDYYREGLGSVLLLVESPIVTKKELIDELESEKVPVRDEPFCALIEQITANREDLFFHLKYAALTESQKNKIKKTYKETIESNPNDFFKKLVKFIQVMLKSDFKIEEVSGLKAQIDELLKNCDLGRISRDLLIDMFIKKGNIDKEDVKVRLLLEKEYPGLSKCSNLVDLLLSLLNRSYVNPKIKEDLDNLIWSKLLNLDGKDPEFQKILTFYAERKKELANEIEIKLQLCRNRDTKTIMMDGKKWVVEKNEKKTVSILELTVSCNKENKVIRYDIRTGKLWIFIC